MQIIINLDDVLNKKLDDVLNKKTVRETLEIEEPLELSDEPLKEGFDITKAQLELDRHYLGMALKQSNGNIRRAGRLVNLSHQTFKNRWFKVRYT